MIDRHKIAAKVFGPQRATRNLADVPLTADDWRKVYEAQQCFRAAVRQIVFEALVRDAEASKTKEPSDATEA